MIGRGPRAILWPPWWAQILMMSVYIGQPPWICEIVIRNCGQVSSKFCSGHEIMTCTNLYPLIHLLRGGDEWVGQIRFPFWDGLWVPGLVLSMSPCCLLGWMEQVYRFVYGQCYRELEEKFFVSVFGAEKVRAGVRPTCDYWGFCKKWDMPLMTLWAPRYPTFSSRWLERDIAYRL